MLRNRHYSESELVEELSRLINKGLGYRSLARRMALRHMEHRHDYTPNTLHQMMLACLMRGDDASGVIFYELALKTRVGGGADIGTQSAVHRDMANFCAKRRNFVLARWEMKDACRNEQFLSPFSNLANHIVLARMSAIQEDYQSANTHLDRAERYADQCFPPNPQYLHNIAWVKLLASVVHDPSNKTSSFSAYYIYVSSDPSPARRFFGAILVSKLPRKLRSRMAAELLSH